MLEKIEGFIMKTQDYGESHKIVTIFSKKLGKFSAIARGAKKPKSRMAASTQPFVYGQYLIYVSTGLSSIQQGEILDSFREIREDIFKTAYTAFIMELTDKLVDKQKPDAFLFEQLRQTIDWINEHDQADIPIMMYEMKLFRTGGFAPVVNQCVNCGSTSAPFHFSIVEGGLLCNSCKMKDPDSIPLPSAVPRLLYLFANVSLDQVSSISVKEENIQLIRQLLDAYYDRYGGYFLKTKKVLKQLDVLK
ncbi:DNA repair protein RecO [Ornithinibacillus gellani]|uniref:DNA repair protein RecO n=1 Tax=Ornithinibacillus gellani TaxID=2293253 RepID=UPI000F46BD81|nr:DNA repair protein RecO [Ornithinibacillus gellani]TQS74572.1 DNA repair protein RecO [Ornithinibacillus gellani]